MTTTSKRSLPIAQTRSAGLTAPPAFLAGIPSNLLRRANGRNDQKRATALLRYCEEAGHRPSFLDLDNERKRRGIR